MNLGLALSALAMSELNSFELFRWRFSEAVQGCAASPGQADAHEAAVSPALVLVDQVLAGKPSARVPRRRCGAPAETPPIH